MDARLAESWVNRDDHVVLGRKLHPFCLYDIFLLTLDENAILLKHRPVFDADLRQAVLICSTEPKVFLSGRRSSSKFWNKWWLVRTARANMGLESLRFQTYMEDYDSRPVFWSDDESGSSLKAPWILSIASFLECYSNMTEYEILTAPVGKMLWKSASIAEFLGLSKDEIMSESDEAAIKELGLDIT